MNSVAEGDANLYMIPVFGKVGNVEMVRLGDLKPGEDWMDPLDWMGTIQLGGEDLCEYGFDGENWYVMQITNPEAYEAAGYTTGEGEVANDDLVPIKQGLIVYSTMGTPITFAGEVLAGDSELYTEADANAYTGNFTPVTIKLGDLVPSADWIDPLDWLGTIQLGGEDLVEFGYDGTDWYVMQITNPEAFALISDLQEGDIANDFEINAAQGIIVYSTMGASVSIPGAID